MNWKRIVAATALIFFVALLWNGMVHMVILKEANAAIEPVARPAAERSLPLSLLLTATLAFLFVWSYAAWRREGGIRQGIAHGLFFAILLGVVVDLNQYVLYPLPPSLPAKWFAFSLVEFVLYGLLVGIIVRGSRSEVTR